VKGLQEEDWERVGRESEATQEETSNKAGGTTRERGKKATEVNPFLKEEAEGTAVAGAKSCGGASSHPTSLPTYMGAAEGKTSTSGRGKSCTGVSDSSAACGRGTIQKKGPPFRRISVSTALSGRRGSLKSAVLEGLPPC